MPLSSKAAPKMALPVDTSESAAAGVQTWTLRDPASLPEGYGDWPDWNDADAIILEAELAAAHGMPFSSRGPAPPSVSGIELWNQTPFNPEKGVWQCWHRGHLPECYTSLSDW